MSDAIGHRAACAWPMGPHNGHVDSKPLAMGTGPRTKSDNFGFLSNWMVLTSQPEM